MNSHPQDRIVRCRIVKGLTGLLCFIALFPFLIIAWQLISKARHLFETDLFTQQEGILNGLSGGVLIFSLTLLLALPLGVLAGLYVQQYSRSHLSLCLGVWNPIFAGMPDILIGMVVFLWLVAPFHQFSVVAGGVSMVILLLPSVVHSTIQSLEDLPSGLKESGLALGASSSMVITRVLFPAVYKPILSEILVAFAQLMGVCTPLIITVCGLEQMNPDDRSSITVALLIWDFFRDPAMTVYVWPCALFLMAVIAVLYIISQLIYPTYDKRIHT
ncbi:MAG: ABC transporter permease subunit [Candidatus Symbiothrix sp.]|jgi:phosphate transport system permease protein|nr:ABC transporter permease subunit [Candidatus Symbiothrix sp.]